MWVKWSVGYLCFIFHLPKPVWSLKALSNHFWARSYRWVLLLLLICNMNQTVMVQGIWAINLLCMVALIFSISGCCSFLTLASFPYWAWNRKPFPLTVTALRTVAVAFIQHTFLLKQLYCKNMYLKKIQCSHLLWLKKTNLLFNVLVIMNGKLKRASLPCIIYSVLLHII